MLTLIAVAAVRDMERDHPLVQKLLALLPAMVIGDIVLGIFACFAIGVVLTGR